MVDAEPAIRAFSHYPAIPSPVAVKLTVLPEHACPYLPGRVAQSRAILAGRLPGTVYRAFMDAGFRRSGRLVYQPICRGCRACVPIRVPVNAFKPDRSQRRCWKQNRDLTVTVAAPSPSDEAFELYKRYLQQWHQSPADAAQATRQAFEEFLYDSPVDCLEFSYRDETGQLLAVGICDVCDASLSSVYFYFEPSQARRGLGTLGALQELAFARQNGILYYYLGYWVDNCSAMAYKDRFQPNELLLANGRWEAGNGQIAAGRRLPISDGDISNYP